MLSWLASPMVAPSQRPANRRLAIAPQQTLTV